MVKHLVLFLCTGNAARSQMAEGILRHLASDAFDVLSAGTEPRAVDPLAVEVMAEIEIDISHQRSKGIVEYLGKIGPRYIIVLCEKAEQRCPKTWPGALNRLYWPLPDPTVAGTEQERLARFRSVRDELTSRITQWLPTARGMVTE